MRIGMIGYGRVGQAVAGLLASRGETYAQRLGEPLELQSILCRDTLREREIPAPQGTLYTDEEKEFFDQEYDLVIECAGGIGRVEHLVRRSLESGADLVTANQTLLSANGAEIFALAEAQRRRIAFEGALAGGAPLVGAIERGLGADHIIEFAGLLSASCNETLTRMERYDESFSEALSHARRAGITMPDEKVDVCGRDTAEKLAILATLMYRRNVDVDAIRTTGIDGITEEDQRLACELGYTIRLIARAQQTDAGVYLRVAPMLVERHEPIAGVYGARCAAFIVGESSGRVMLTGEGAGAMPAASAIISDVLHLGALRRHRGEGALNAWPADAPDLEIAPAGETVKRFYVRMPVQNHETGVRPFLDHLKAGGVGVRVLHELAGMLVLVTEPTTRVRLDKVMTSAPEGGLDVRGRITLRVYTPAWTL